MKKDGWIEGVPGQQELMSWPWGKVTPHESDFIVEFTIESMDENGETHLFMRDEAEKNYIHFYIIGHNKFAFLEEVSEAGKIVQKIEKQLKEISNTTFVIIVDGGKVAVYGNGDLIDGCACPNTLVSSLEMKLAEYACISEAMVYPRHISSKDMRYAGYPPLVFWLYKTRNQLSFLLKKIWKKIFNLK